MGRELKPGDRVRIKGFAAIGHEAELVDGEKAKLVKMMADEMWSAETDRGATVTVTASQCRRLRKRERRRIWVDPKCHAGFTNKAEKYGTPFLANARFHPTEGWIEFTESPPRKAGEKERE